MDVLRNLKKHYRTSNSKVKAMQIYFKQLLNPEDLANPQQAPITMPGGGGSVPKDLAQAKTFDEYKAIRKAQN